MESIGQPYSLEIRSYFDNLENPRVFECCLPASVSLLVLKTLNEGPDLDMKFASIYVALLGLTSLIKAALTTHHYDYLTELWGLKLKVALTGLVYKKVSSVII